MLRADFRADRAHREVADWVRLVALVLGTPHDGARLFGGPGARLIAWICQASAVTLGNAVFFSARGWNAIMGSSESGLLLLAHEMVHVRQYRDLGPARFLGAYLGEYFRGRLRGRSHRQAYLEISFESEARRGELVARRLLAEGALLRAYPTLVRRS